MLREIQQKSIFRLAQEAAFDYLDGVSERNVFPDDEALADLQYLVETILYSQHRCVCTIYTDRRQLHEVDQGYKIAVF